MSSAPDRETSPARHIVDASAERGRRRPRRESARTMRARELAESPITFHDTLVTQILTGQGSNDSLHIPAWLDAATVDEVRTRVRQLYKKSNFGTVLQAPVKGVKAKDNRRTAHVILRKTLLDATKELLQEVKLRNESRTAAANASVVRHAASADLVGHMASIDAGISAVANIKGLRELGKIVEQLQRYQTETQRQAEMLLSTSGALAAMEFTARRYEKSAKAVAMIGDVAQRLSQRLQNMPDVQQKLDGALKEMTSSDRAMTIARDARARHEYSIDSISRRLKQDLREQAVDYTKTNLKKLVDKAVPQVKVVPSFAEFEVAAAAAANDDQPRQKSMFGRVLSVGIVIAAVAGIVAAMGPSLRGQLWHRGQELIDNQIRLGQGPCTLPEDQIATYMPEGSTHPRVVVCYRDSNFDETNHIRLADVPAGAPLRILFTEGTYRRQTATVSRETYVDPVNGTLALMEQMNPYAAGFEMPLGEPEDAPAVSLASVIAPQSDAEASLRGVVAERRRSAPADAAYDDRAAYVPPPAAEAAEDARLTRYTPVDDAVALLDGIDSHAGEASLLRPERANVGEPKAAASTQTAPAPGVPLFK